MVPDGRLAPTAGVPTMLSREEERLYYWLAREGMGGSGAVADLGSFVGGSTARMAQGLVDGGLGDPVHLFDRFTASEKVKHRLFYRAGILAFEGEDILPLSRQLLAPWADRLHWHRGEIETLAWPDDAPEIRLMTLDLCKVPGPSDHVARTFLPRLRLGAYVNQQDMTQWDQPWTAVQMLLLTDWLEPVGFAGTSMVFRCTAIPTARDLRHAEIADLDDETLIGGLEEAKQRFATLAWPQTFDRLIAAVRANPGIRKPWQMKPPPDPTVA